MTAQSPERNPSEGPERVLVSASPAATEALGELLGGALGPGDVVALEGELGSGKTCLVRGLARGLGVTDPVTSPTFTLMHTYAGRVPLHHFDAWMEGREQALLEGGGAEWLRAEGVAVVEWAERVSAWLPEPRIRIRLGHLDPERRRIGLSAVGAAGGRLAGLLEALKPPPGMGEESDGSR